MSVIKSTKKTKLILLALAEAAMLLLSSCAKSDRTQSIEYLSEKYSVPEEKQLVVYTSHKEEVYLPIIREFENQTGIWVEIHAGGTEEMMNEARKASESGQCDIMFGGGVLFTRLVRKQTSTSQEKTSCYSTDSLDDLSVQEA